MSLIKIMHNDTSFDLTVRGPMKVSDVKLAIEGRYRIPSDFQKLYMNGTELVNDLTLASYGIVKGADLTLITSVDDEATAQGRESDS